MRLNAGAALAIYLLCSFLVSAGRGWLQYRRTGDYGFRAFSGRAGSVGWFAERLLTLAWLAGLLAFPPALWGGASWFQAVPPPAMRVSGLTLMVIAAALTLIAQGGMRASWRIGVDHDEVTELVTTGLFRWVRNPIFDAMIGVFLGLVLTIPNLVAGVALAAALIGIELQVRGVEEPYLMRVHGERYRAYARRVGRFVPGLGRMT